MDLLSYLRILRRRWVLIVAVAVAGAALGAGTAVASSSGGDSGSYYKATHLMFLDTTSDDSGSSAFSNLDQIALLVTTGDVPNEVGKKLGQDGRQLAEHVIVTTNSVTSTLDITAIADTGREAEEIADTFADEIVTSLNQKDQERFDAKRDRVVERLDEVQAEIAAFDAQVAGGGGDLVKAQRDALVNQYRLTYEQFQQLAEQGSPVTLLSTLEEATPVPIGKSEYDQRLSLGQLGENLRQAGNSSSSDDGSAAEITSSSSSLSGPVSRGAFGAFLGLLIGGGIAIAMEHLDRRLRTREDVEDVYGVPVLAGVPKLPKQQREETQVLSRTAPLSRTAEAHRAVRSALLFQHLTQQAPGGNGEGSAAAASTASFVADDVESTTSLVVLVTSALPNEGKTTTTANLAAVFAESGASVLAVNCDFRRPTLHRYLGAEHEPRRVQESNIPGVALVSGVASDPAANPAQVIAAQRQVVATARDRFDVILLDTAPLLTTNDAIEIVPVVDLLVLVARPDVTTVDGAERTRTLLERVNAPVAGVVFVGDEAVSNDEYYYYAQASGVAAAASTASEREDAEEGDAEPEASQKLEVEGAEAEAAEEPDETDEDNHAKEAQVVEAEAEDPVDWASEEPTRDPEPDAPASEAMTSEGEQTEEIAAVTTADDEPEAEPAKKPRRRKRRVGRSN